MKALIIASILSISTLSANGGGGGFDVMQFVPLVLIFVIFYFLIMRPQQKKARAHQEMLKELRRGDRVVTAGGLLGTVDKIINDGELSIEIADNIKVRVVKSTVTEVVSKTQPVVEMAQKASSSPKAAQQPALNVTKKPTSNPTNKKVVAKAKSAAKPTAKKSTAKSKK